MISTPVRILSKIDPTLRRKAYQKIFPKRISEWDSMKTEDHPGGMRFAPILDKKVLFIHIPKCAGTSVSKVIFGGPTGSHLPLWKYEMAFSRKELASLWMFSFFRNPYARVLSAYHFLKRGGFLSTDEEFRDTYIGDADFNQFVQEGLTRKPVRKHILFRDQLEFILSGSLPKPLHFAGFCETFQEDFSKVLRHLKIDRDRAKTRANVSGSKPRDYREKYEPASIDVVTNLYRNDLDELGYSFDKPFDEEQRTKVARFCR